MSGIVSQTAMRGVCLTKAQRIGVTSGKHCGTQWAYRWRFRPSFRLHDTPAGRRRIHIGQVLMPPAIFTGLFLALWTYKCIMLVLFQNTIIYNPFLPPNARRMRISEFAHQCRGIQWREERISSLDGTEIALCVSEVSSESHNQTQKRRVYILYFQGMPPSMPAIFFEETIANSTIGNASSLPPRLPEISSIIHQLKDVDESFHYTIVCLSYRGFWTSHDRPSETGINMDSEAALQWISRLHKNSATEKPLVKPVVILWGQSIGCGFATNLAASTGSSANFSVDALVLETPFTNTKAMLTALYPQKWLPYRHLWPFLRNHLDSWANFGIISRKKHEHRPGIYLVEAGNDELVPAGHGASLYRRCQDVGLSVERHKIRGALHNGVMVRKEGKQTIARFISLAISRAGVKSVEEKQAASGVSDSDKWT